MIDPNEKIRFVELVKYQPEWALSFTLAAKEIKSILKENCLQIYHIGSTAIPNIYAKPIIDIMPVVNDLSIVDSLNEYFEKLDYVCMGEYGIPGRRFYWRSKAKRTHHIHLFQKDSLEIARHLLFKEFMVAHEDYAQAYTLIKRSLAEVFHDDIVNYVNGKSSFVQMIEYKTGAVKAEQHKAEDNIIIEPYDSAWEKLAEAEIKIIKKISEPLHYLEIEHIGSTAVPGLASKPIIDIFIVLESIEKAEQWIKPLETVGYVFWDENPDKSHLRFFKGMPPFGMKRTHHIHIVAANNDTFEQRVLFRDILRCDNEIKQEYELLKLKLSDFNSLDREAYTDKKGKFIEKVLRAHGYLKPIFR